MTHKFSINGHEGYLTLDFLMTAALEIFIKMAKEGSTLSGLIQGFCRAFSLCLQFGCLRQTLQATEGMRFDPMAHEQP